MPGHWNGCQTAVKMPPLLPMFSLLLAAGPSSRPHSSLFPGMLFLNTKRQIRVQGIPTVALTLSSGGMQARLGRYDGLTGTPPGRPFTKLICVIALE